MRPFVELEGVAVDYGPVRVLDGINLTVDPGDFLGIIGPNGSGKTTLLRVMLGLLPPTEGAVRLFGKPPAAFREWGRLGYVPQKATLDPALPVTVEEVVASGLVPVLRLFQRTGKAERTRIREVLARVGMEAHARARIGALSTGQHLPRSARRLPERRRAHGLVRAVGSRREPRPLAPCLNSFSSGSCSGRSRRARSPPSSAP